MPWKNKVTMISENIFPGLQQCNNFCEDVLSSLPLQMSLYFNTILLPFWMGALLQHTIYNYGCFNEIYKFITITTIIVLFTNELLRLYMGYKGNLEDKLPELAGFWLLSILIQLPLQICLLFNPHFQLYIVEIVLQTIILLLLLVQIISCYINLKLIINQKSIKTIN